MLKPTDLTEHPEGGRFREVYRSPLRITRGDGATKTALTHIYFSLARGEKSRFHKVIGDEIWNLYRGSGLYLYVWDGSERPPVRIALSAETNCFCHVVPSGHWQAAEPMTGQIAGKIADDVLVGCSVAPGFDFADFELIEPTSETARRLAAIAPGLRHLISG